MSLSSHIKEHAILGTGGIEWLIASDQTLLTGDKSGNFDIDVGTGRLSADNLDFSHDIGGGQAIYGYITRYTAVDDYDGALFAGTVTGHPLEARFITDDFYAGKFLGPVDIATVGPSAGNLTVDGIIQGGTLTDGTATLTGGSLTSVKLGTLTDNGFVKTGSGDGTLSVDTSTYLTSLAFAGLSDYPVDASGVLTNDGIGNLSWGAGGGGYTNLTEFVDQTAWRLFYSNTDGDVIEFAFGAVGKVLTSGGASANPTWETPAAEADTLDTVCDRGATTDQPIITGGLETNADLEVNQHAFFTAEIDNGNSGAADTIDWGAGNKQMSTLTDNCTFTFTAPDGVGNFLLKLVQDGTGSRTAVWPATVKWVGGTAPTLTTIAAGVDIATFYFDGTSYFGVASLAFAVPV